MPLIHLLKTPECSWRHLLLLLGASSLVSGFGTAHFGTGKAELCDVKGAAKIGEGYNIVHKDRCRQFCDLTPDCKFWTWYKVHCDKLPCMGDEFTKREVCYALKSCDLVFQKCDGCTSGTKTGQRVGLSASKAREAAEAIIRSEKRNRLLEARTEL